MQERLLYEEAAFAADIREEERPVDAKLNGNGKEIRKQTPSGEQLALKL